MLEKAVKRAMEKLAATVATKYKQGSEHGKIAAGLFLATPPTVYILSKVVGSKGETKEVQATQKKAVHLDDKGNINTSANGKLVAAIYEDEDGHFHKQTNDKWYIWNGSEWV